ncbi:IS21-like element helper ATPase IstB [Sulfurovum sp.]|jgi:DNA replication protein DnaC|uniref:IS21-like element helper ATPase IstB n=1 Tax=Sulfurovum sp. TaxID=1969726 RepID=UPI002A36D9EA|nr:IS21-like element helper ATPase IstB [Sulfurovum sp.]MDY0402414.1 IS21-like element helper ATPase IstB [Sulfurovum sp.]
MTLSTLTQQLDTLGFSGFKAALQRQSEDANYMQLSFEERLYGLLEAEQSERTQKRIKRLLSQAKLKERQASLELVEYSAKRGLERSQILSLASGEYISKRQNILITGATGVGKSFLAQALAKQAIFEGYSARYYRVTRLLEELKLARVEGSYTNTLQKLSRINLLILDDFGVTPLKSDELNDLFEVIEDRTLSGSTIITAQLPVKEWHNYLGNATIADAMMDRLIYSAHRIEMKGESMRKLMAQK